jgi:hypothetical protein
LLKLIIHFFLRHTSYFPAKQQETSIASARKAYTRFSDLLMEAMHAYQIEMVACQK